MDFFLSFFFNRAKATVTYYRVMDDLRFYVLFNSISVSQDDGRLIMKGCVQWLRRFHLERGSNSVR